MGLGQLPLPEGLQNAALQPRPRCRSTASSRPPKPWKPSSEPPRAPPGARPWPPGPRQRDRRRSCGTCACWGTWRAIRDLPSRLPMYCSLRQLGSQKLHPQLAAAAARWISADPCRVPAHRWCAGALTTSNLGAAAGLPVPYVLPRRQQLCKQGTHVHAGHLAAARCHRLVPAQLPSAASLPWPIFVFQSGVV